MIDRGNEELKKQEEDKAPSLMRTLAVSLFIGGAISALGIAYIAFRGEYSNLWRYSFLISYAAWAVLGIALGFLCLFLKGVKQRKALSLISAVWAFVLSLSFIPNGIFLKNWSIAISIGVVGACIGAIGILVDRQIAEMVGSDK